MCRRILNVIYIFYFFFFSQNIYTNTYIYNFYLLCILYLYIFVILFHSNISYKFLIKKNKKFSYYIFNYIIHLLINKNNAHINFSISLSLFSIWNASCI